MLTRAEFRELIAHAQGDPEPFIASCFDIETKMLPGQPPVVRFVFNRAQRRVHQAILQARAEGRPGRFIVLKSRQPGISTQASAYVTATGLTRPHSASMQIAQDEDASIGIFRKIEFMLDRLPPDLVPKRSVDRRDEIVLNSMPCKDGEVPLHSTIAVGWAGGKESWRSKTLQTVHISEFSIMPNATELLVGILQAVPPTSTSLVIIESTARGIGNAFHQQWELAEAGQSAFTPIFIPWFDLPENELRVPSDFTLDPEEVELARLFQLSDGQIAWRRWKIAELMGDIGRFNQEHPATAADAFLMSGLPVFDTSRLRLLHEQALMAPPPETGVYTLEHGFTAYERGPLRIYRRPVPGHEYTIGADPSSGVPGGDPACAQVFDRTTGEQVAVWHGYANPVVFAAVTNALGRWYNDAILAPELNGGYGSSMIEELKAFQYPMLYQWSRHDKVRNVITNFLGWWTTFRTKQHLIDTTAHGLVEGDFRLYDLVTIQECEKFQYYDGVRAEGVGAHDDAVMAFLIAYRVHIESPLRETGLPPRVRSEVFGTPKDPEIPMPAGTMNAEAWRDADDQLAAGGRRQRIQDELVQPDEEDLEDGGKLPAWLDHPW